MYSPQKYDNHCPRDSHWVIIVDTDGLVLKHQDISIPKAESWICLQAFPVVNGLTHWGQDKMATNFLAISNAFSWMEIYKFRLKFHWSLLLGVQLIMPALVLIMARRRAIIWTNDGLFYCRIYASLALNDLRNLFFLVPSDTFLFLVNTYIVLYTICI